MRSGLFPGCGRNGWQQVALDAAGIEGADLFIKDRAIRADQITLRNAVDAPVYRGLAVRIDAYRSKGIAELAEEAQRIILLVLVVDADDGDAAVFRQFLKQRMLLPAGNAPEAKTLTSVSLPLMAASVSAGRFEPSSGGSDRVGASCRSAPREWR